MTRITSSFLLGFILGFTSLGLTRTATITSPGGDEVTIAEGESLQLVCEDDLSEINSWKLNGMPLDDNPDFEITSSGYTSTLTIVSALQSNQGRFRCEIDPFTYDEIVVKVVEGEPEAVTIVEPESDTVTVSSGDSFNMKCTGAADVSLYWTHNGMQIAEDSRRIITTARDINSNKATSLISIRNIGDDDAGNYECKDEDDPIFNVDSVQVDVVDDEDQGSVEIFSPSESSISVSPAHRIDLKCKSLEGTELGWFKDGDEIDEDEAIISTAVEDGSQVSYLTVEDADADDSGRYSCRNLGDPEDEDSVSVTVGDDDDDGDSDLCLFCGAESSTASMVIVSMVTIVGLMLNRQP